jgi:outer membrane protein
MNRILIALIAVLFCAVAFLFYRSFYSEKEEPATEIQGTIPGKKKDSTRMAEPTTGRIAFVDIDRLNEESLEIKDLVSESKRRKMNIEASIESLSMEYERQMKEYENSVKAGIAPQSVIQAKERDIMALRKEAENKQLQMDNFTMEVNEKNAAFQKGVKDYLDTWNEGRYDYIFSYSDAVPTMLLGKKSLEITGEIIEGLNNQYRAKKNRSNPEKK